MTFVKMFWNLRVQLAMAIIFVCCGLVSGCTLVENIQPKSRGGITGTKIDQSFSGEWDLVIDVQTPEQADIISYDYEGEKREIPIKQAVNATGGYASSKGRYNLCLLEMTPQKRILYVEDAGYKYAPAFYDITGGQYWNHWLHIDSDGSVSTANSQPSFDWQINFSSAKIDLIIHHQPGLKDVKAASFKAHAMTDYRYLRYQFDHASATGAKEKAEEIRVLWLSLLEEELKHGHHRDKALTQSDIQSLEKSGGMK